MAEQIDAYRRGHTSEVGKRFGIHTRQPKHTVANGRQTFHEADILRLPVQDMVALNAPDGTYYMIAGIHRVGDGTKAR